MLSIHTALYVRVMASHIVLLTSISNRISLIRYNLGNICIDRCLCLTVSSSSGQRLSSRTDSGLCRDVVCTTPQNLSLLNGCIVVVGNLKLLTLEKTNSNFFRNITFPELREVTGFMVVYRVLGLESLGQLFPNLARIRGTKLFDNYGLIVHDVPHLRNIGLSSLLKIDRGGVVMWGGPHTCFVLTVDWNTIAPRSRHVLANPDLNADCNFQCTCTTNASTNHCWSNKKCQRYLSGPDGEHCNEQCLGCRKTNANECSVCRRYTYKGQCISNCPNDTILLPDNQYCITESECLNLKGWTLNNTCVFECPVDYIEKKSKENTTTCEPCLNCQMNCQNLKIQTLSKLQLAKPCVFVNGSLAIHIRAVPNVMEELKENLGQIQEVTDYIIIHGSITITSLDFFSSLRVIGGRKLASNTYSLIIRDMFNLQTLFSPNVTNNLQVRGGKAKMHGNPILCMSKVEELVAKFPVKSNYSDDIPIGTNGYSGGCSDAQVNLKVKVWNETSATVIFSPLINSSIEHTILYVRLPPGTRTSIVPETCSESEWSAISASASGIVDLTSLRPASTYAICIETFSFWHENGSLKTNLARSSITNFTTPVGKPAPPFIIELVASSYEVVVLRWVDHKDYRPHITSYELDIKLIEIHSKDITARDHCNVDEAWEDTEYSRHAVVLKPPPNYDRGCESMCGVLSTVTAGAMAEDNFDICDSLDSDCDNAEVVQNRTNSSFGIYTRTLSLDIKGPRNDFQIGGLAPFRDYKFKLRACIGKTCSRSTRSVVRTLRCSKADIPSVTSYSVNDTGHVFVSWEPPVVTNGPVLSYSVHILPYVMSDMGYILPQAWCVLPDNYNLTVKSQYVSKYKIRVCSTTLGSFNACSEWQKLIVRGFDKRLWTVSGMRNNLLLAGVIFGLCIIIISNMIAYIWSNRRTEIIDMVPLVDMTSTDVNESEPPATLYSVPLRDTPL